MKTIINRLDLHRFERLVSKIAKPSELPATVSFALCSDGMMFSAFCAGAALTLTVPSGDDVVEPFTLPWATVKEFAAKRNEYIKRNAPRVFREGDLNIRPLTTFCQHENVCYCHKSTSGQDGISAIRLQKRACRSQRRREKSD